MWSNTTVQVVRAQPDNLLAAEAPKNLIQEEREPNWNGDPIATQPDSNPQCVAVSSWDTFTQEGFPRQGLPQWNKLQTPIYLFCSLMKGYKIYKVFFYSGMQKVGCRGSGHYQLGKLSLEKKMLQKKSSPSFSISLHKWIVGKVKPGKFHCLPYPNLHLIYVLQAGLGAGRGIRPEVRNPPVTLAKDTRYF